MLIFMLFMSDDIIITDYNETGFLSMQRPQLYINKNGEEILNYVTNEYFTDGELVDANTFVFTDSDTFRFQPIRAPADFSLFIFAWRNSTDGFISDEGLIYRVQFIKPAYTKAYGHYLYIDIFSEDMALLKEIRHEFFDSDLYMFAGAKLLTNNKYFALVAMDERNIFIQYFNMQGDSITNFIKKDHLRVDDAKFDACMLENGEVVVVYENKGYMNWIAFDTLGEVVHLPDTIPTGNNGRGEGIEIARTDNGFAISWIESHTLKMRWFNNDFEPITEPITVKDGSVKDNYSLSILNTGEACLLWYDINGYYNLSVSLIDNNRNVIKPQISITDRVDAGATCYKNDKTGKFHIYFSKSSESNEFANSIYSIIMNKQGFYPRPYQRIDGIKGVHHVYEGVSMNRRGEFAVIYRASVYGHNPLYLELFDKDSKRMFERIKLDSNIIYRDVYLTDDRVVAGYVKDNNIEIKFKVFDLEGRLLNETIVTSRDSDRVKGLSFAYYNDTIDMFTAMGYFVIHRKVKAGAHYTVSLDNKTEIVLDQTHSGELCVDFLSNNEYLVSVMENKEDYQYHSMVYHLKDRVIKSKEVPEEGKHSNFVVARGEGGRFLSLVEMAGLSEYNYALMDTSFNVIKDTTLGLKGGGKGYSWVKHTSDIIMHNNRAILFLTDFSLEHIRAKGLILNTETGSIIGELPIGADIDEPWYRTVVNKGSVAGNDSLFVVVWLDNRNNRGFDVYAHVYKWEDFEGIEEEKNISNTIVKLTGTDLFLNTVSYTIYDVQGRIVLKGNKKRVPLKDFSQGIYFIKYKNNNKGVVKKLVIIK